MKLAICDIRWAEVNLLKIETQPTFDIFEEREESFGRENLLHSAEIERLTLDLRNAEIEKTRLRSLLKDAQHTVNSWSLTVEEMYPTGVGSWESTLMLTAHTAGNTSQSTLRNCTAVIAVYLHKDFLLQRSGET